MPSNKEIRILYLPRFAREFKNLPSDIKTLAGKREKIFRKNPFDARLKTHKLSGEFSEFWAFSIKQKYRIIFDFQDDYTIRFYRVGTHDIY